MSEDGFLLLLSLGAAVLALWIALRFPTLGPSNVGRALLHVAAALAVGYAVAPAMRLLGAPASPLVPVLCVALPGLIYMFLSGAWLIRAAVTGRGPLRR
jgi:hypothetical protein